MRSIICARSICVNFASIPARFIVSMIGDKICKKSSLSSMNSILNAVPFLSFKIPLSNSQPASSSNLLAVRNAFLSNLFCFITGGM